MSKRPRAEMNGNGSMNGKGSHNGNGKGHPSAPPEPSRRKLPRAISTKRSLPLLPLTVICLAVALALGVANLHDSRFSNPPVTTSENEPFRLAVNQAMNAAQLTQTASSQEEWQTVVNWWQEAIKLMEAVPRTSSNYGLAQDKVAEYQRNLDYAQSKARQASTFPTDGIWGISSRRAEVLRVQGEPTEAVRYDSLCQEVLSFNRSSVELRNGIVVRYEDTDKNLKVAAKEAPAPPPHSVDSWMLGSTREDVFRIQGTPARIIRYDASSKELLYYNSSTIELTDGRVTSYNNLDKNLRVAIVPVPTTGPVNDYWTVGSERNDVFRVQGTPEQVTLDNSLCREVLHYGDSTVEMKNGFVTGYDNFSNNLRVRLK